MIDKKRRYIFGHSGGQYKFGTDVTRTISLENFNKRIKDILQEFLKDI